MDEVANCLRHKKLTEEYAKRRAYQLRHKKKFRGIVAYPCDVGGERHWHIGRTKRR